MHIQPNGAGYRPEIEDVPYGYDDGASLSYEDTPKTRFINNFISYAKNRIPDYIEDDEDLTNFQ